MALSNIAALGLGRVENLDSKTMRYPGHVKLMNFFFHELLMREKRDLARTTSASACAVVERVRDGKLPAAGLLKQEDISLEEFLKTRTGRYYR